MEGEGDFRATFGVKTGQFTWHSVASQFWVSHLILDPAPRINIDKSHAMEMRFCFKKYSVGENEKQQNSLITFVFRYKHNV